MCLALSYRRQQSTNQLSFQLCYIGRLLLANGSDELLPGQKSILKTRLRELWNQTQQLMQLRWHICPARARRLTKYLITRLLREPCCRRALRQSTSLETALGPAAYARG